MSKQNFLKHFVTIGSGTLINMLLGLLTTPVITRMVDPHEYGQVSIFQLYATLASMILCLGLDQSLVRFYYENDSTDYKKALLFRCVMLPVIITSALSAVVIVLSAFNIIEFEFSTAIMVLLCVCTMIQLIYRFSILMLRLAYKSKKYALLNVLHKAFYFAVAVALLLILKNYDLIALVIATVVSYAICLVISILSERSKWIFKGVKEISIPEKELLKYAFPFIISMSITQIFHAINQITLKHYCTFAEVGIFASTMTLIHIFAIVQTSFNAVWAPMMVEHYTKNPEERSFYQKGHCAITVIMFFIGLSLILIKDVFAILLGAKFREAAYILPFLIFNPIMYTISETTCGGLVFMKKSNMQVLVALGACVTNIIGNIILVPILECKGAAISTGISYIVFFTLRTLLANKYYYTDFKLHKLYFITALTCVYAYLNTFYRFGTWTVAGYVICVAILIFVYKDTIVWGHGYVRRTLRSLRQQKK